MNQAKQLSLPIFLLLFFVSFPSFSQEILFSPADSCKAYHIVTLNDGTVLKGKILSQENKTILFQDEMLGNVTFRTRDVSSMEKVEPQHHYLITMMNGTTLQGKIVSRKEKEIVVETSNIGNVTVDLAKLKTIKEITPANMNDGQYWFTTPVDAHYFISPSSIPLHSRETYYQNTMLLFNSFQTGITKHVSLTGGMIVPFAAFVSPHIGYQLRKGIYAGGGILFAVRTGQKYVGLGYGMLTFGNRKSHLSIGGGYGYFTYQHHYYHSKITTAYVTAFTISGMKRLSPRYALVTENWFAADEGFGVYSGGLRLMGEKASWDFGIGKLSISRKIAGNAVSLGPVSFISYMRNL